METEAPHILSDADTPHRVAYATLPVALDLDYGNGRKGFYAFHVWGPIMKEVAAAVKASRGSKIPFRMSRSSKHKCLVFIAPSLNEALQCRAALFGKLVPHLADGYLKTGETFQWIAAKHSETAGFTRRTAVSAPKNRARMGSVLQRKKRP